jgi:hypothetical protein
MNTGTPVLGWAKDGKLTANGKRVWSVTFGEAYAVVSTSEGKWIIDEQIFNPFVGAEWDVEKTHAYTVRGY